MNTKCGKNMDEVIYVSFPQHPYVLRFKVCSTVHFLKNNPYKVEPQNSICFKFPFTLRLLGLTQRGPCTVHFLYFTLISSFANKALMVPLDAIPHVHTLISTSFGLVRTNKVLSEARSMGDFQFCTIATQPMDCGALHPTASFDLPGDPKWV